jgi:hypothetical protein
MQYDDFYNESKGEYWRFASMTFSEKLTAVGFHLWNVVNLAAIGYIIYRIIKRPRKG